MLRPCARASKWQSDSNHLFTGYGKKKPKKQQQLCLVFNFMLVIYFLEKAVCAHGTKIPSDLSSTEITVIIVISDLCTFYQLD